MIGRPDKIAILSRAATGPGSTGVAGFLAGLAGTVALLACSSAPVKMECRELQMRIDYGDLTADQMRFAMEELAACQGRAKEAEQRDSALIEGTERRFTPADE